MAVRPSPADIRAQAIIIVLLTLLTPVLPYYPMHWSEGTGSAMGVCMGIDVARRMNIQRLGRVQVIKVDDWLHVVCPFNEMFNESAKKLHGKWRPAAHAWVFPVSKRASVLELVRRSYGPSRGPCIGHKFLKVEGGIKCMFCKLFKERSL